MDEKVNQQAQELKEAGDQVMKSQPNLRVSLSRALPLVSITKKVF
jgi:hypothetical protein